MQQPGLTVSRFIDNVILRSDTDPAEHMRQGAMQRPRPLLATELIMSWRASAQGLPGELVSALRSKRLAPPGANRLGGPRRTRQLRRDLAAEDRLTSAGTR